MVQSQSAFPLSHSSIIRTHSPRSMNSRLALLSFAPKRSANEAIAFSLELALGFLVSVLLRWDWEYWRYCYLGYLGMLGILGIFRLGTFSFRFHFRSAIPFSPHLHLRLWTFSIYFKGKNTMNKVKKQWIPRAAEPLSRSPTHSHVDGPPS